MTPEEILLQLRGVHHSFPVDAVRTIQADPKTYTPLLTELLRRVGDEYRNRPGYYRPNDAKIAFTLLTEFCIPEAWPALLEFLSLPEDAFHSILDEGFIDSLINVLAVYLNPETDDFERLTTDSSFSFWPRVCAIIALWCWHRDGKVSYEDAVRRTDRVLRLALDEHDDGTLGAFISFSCPLAVAAAESVLRDAADEDMIELAFAKEEDIDAAIEELETNPAERFGNMPAGGVKDTVEELRNQECFHEDPGVEDFDFDWEEHDIAESDDDYSDDDYSDDEEWDADDEFVEEKYMQKYISELDPEDKDFVLRAINKMQLSLSESEPEPPQPPETIRNSGPRIGRNDPCPCGSGKKYKKCCAKPE
jgi:hypothetical protein